MIMGMMGQGPHASIYLPPTSKQKQKFLSAPERSDLLHPHRMAEPLGAAGVVARMDRLAAGIFETENAAAIQCHPRLILATRSKLRNDVDVFERRGVALDEFAGGDLFQQAAHDFA